MLALNYGLSVGVDFPVFESKFSVDTCVHNRNSTRVHPKVKELGHPH